jgi:hypothetical protein
MTPGCSAARSVSKGGSRDAYQREEFLETLRKLCLAPQKSIHPLRVTAGGAPLGLVKSENFYVLGRVSIRSNSVHHAMRSNPASRECNAARIV